MNRNGRFIENGNFVVSADNRGLRYGDGLFETMKFAKGRIALEAYHFERLLTGMNTLKIERPPLMTVDYLRDQVLRTLSRNKITGRARIRLMVFRGDGGLFEAGGQGGGWIIQVWPLEDEDAINANGLLLGVYDEGRKSNDALANLKSNNYLVYVMAALHAKANRWNDCLVLNTQGRVCDSAIANLFWTRSGRIYTVPLSEGCIAGVMRRHLIDILLRQEAPVIEQPVTLDELLQADELFLTNAVKGIRWVGELNGKTFDNQLSRRLFAATISG